MPEDVKQTLFSKLYSASAETLKTMKKPVALARTKRKISAAYDAGHEAKLDAENQKQTLLEAIPDINVNAILDLNIKIGRAEEIKSETAKLYKELFDEELKVDY